MEEHEWVTFVSEWKEYKRERNLAGDGVLVAELCESMSKRLLMRISQCSSRKGSFPQDENEMLDSMKNVVVAIHPRIQSIDLLTSSTPAQCLQLLKGKTTVPHNSFYETPTNDEIIFCSLLFKFKTDDIMARVKDQKIKTSEDLVAYLEAEEKKKSKRPRSRQRSLSPCRSRSCSILKNRSENMAEDSDGEERGRKRMKGEERMMTRSRSRAAAGAKSVRICEDERVETEPTRESLFDDDPSAPDIPQLIFSDQSKSKKRWTWICNFCGK